MKFWYRPRRLLRTASRCRVRRRSLSLVLCVSLLLALFPAVVRAEGENAVTFVNFDLSPLEGAYTFSGVPSGTRLYPADELMEVAGFVPAADCGWYLYYPGGGEVGAYGPHAIADPPERDGYIFQDWAAQNADGDDIYTVTENTTFVARYVSLSQYIVNLYYLFDNQAGTVAAETSTVPYGLGEGISIPLPQSESLAGLSPLIVSDSADQAVQGAVAALNGMLQGAAFSGVLDGAFLENCRTAGFVGWDEAQSDYEKDENGNVQISIPVTYQLTGEVKFEVAYYQQDAENPYIYHEVEADHVTGSVTGTTRVSLEELGLVARYAGFTLTAASAENAASYSVNANGTSVIPLYYDRNIHYIYYQMNGGNALDPVPLRYGQAIPGEVTAEESALRAGYTFAGWTWMDGEGGQMDSAPAAMPDQDLTLEANWSGADTTVTLVYWLENANDDAYTVAGQRQITVTSGQTVGYQDPAYPANTVAVDISGYTSPDAMAVAGVDDGKYFTFASADSSTQYPPGVEGGPKTAAGDGTTVINIGYTRNEYTLVFHLGKISDGTDGLVNTWVYISTGGNSNSSDPTDWTSGYTGWTAGGKQAELNINGQSYKISNDDADCYQITAKYGAYISQLWPVATDGTTSNVTYNGVTYRLFTWGTHKKSPYYSSHTDNRNIIGVYPTLSAELIIDPENPDVVHHLTAYWSASNSGKTHHYMFESVPGTTGTAVSFSQYAAYSGVNTQGSGGKEAVKSLSFYEYDSTQVRTSAESWRQNAPAFANVTYRYGCFRGDDIYFFYTYDDYTLTYHENNPNLITGELARSKTVPFHYVDGKPVAELIEEEADYTPEQPYVSSYGNEYTFGGWYTSNSDFSARYRVDWSSFAPASNVNVYAAWTAPTFTLTLIVPGGVLYQDSLDQFEEKNYDWTSFPAVGTDGELVTTYVISGIPGGTKGSEIVEERKGAQSSHGLAFDYWGYEVNGTEQRYLFDESQLVVDDLTLTARWKTEYTGRYTVRYLTQEVQENGLDTVEMEGRTYYRLLEDRTVTGVAVGSSVTEEAQPFSGYLSTEGTVTKVVEAGAGDESITVFDFFYEKVTGRVTYTVHYVRDTGADYGRTAPPEDVLYLAPDKAVTVEEAALNNSTSVQENAVMVGGHTPRDSWSATLALSADEAQNHLYFYYVSNVLELSFQAVYHFQNPQGEYEPDQALTFSGTAALGQVLSSAELVTGYGRYFEDTDALAEEMVGHILDEALTQPYLLVTQAEANNVLHIYLKNGQYSLTYDLNSGGDIQFPVSWPDAGAFLTEEAGGGAWYETVTYPNPATVPQTVPSRLSYRFTGWNTAADGSGAAYPAEELSGAPWYTGSGLYQDVTLYAQWERQFTVTFHLREGSWTDSGSGFYESGDSMSWYAYVDPGGAAPQPRDPTYELSDGTKYSFIGWTAENPNDWAFTTQDKRIDLAAFEQYRYDFTWPVAQPLHLYAVWDPDVTTVQLVKTDTGDLPLSGAEFALERLQATVSGDPDKGYTYTLLEDSQGNYLPDGGFVTRVQTTPESGLAEFRNLPAGYYRLTETAAPAGYTGLSAPVILYAPYGGTPAVVENPDSAHVTGSAQGGDLTVAVQNISQYSVTIRAPDSLTLTYTPPDLIWNPESLRYEEAGSGAGQWQVAAPEQQAPEIVVENTSPSNSALTVSVSLSYLERFSVLLPLSTLSGDAAFTPSETAEGKALTGTLNQKEQATFTLSLTGTLPLGTALPGAETEAGSLTVLVSRPSG